jgi:hypothetical protein
MLRWICGGCLEQSTTDTKQIHSDVPKQTVIRMSTADIQLLYPIPIEDGTYRIDEYSLRFVENNRHGRKFAMEHILHQLKWEREPNHDVFSIRDRMVSQLIDFSIGDEEMVCGIAEHAIIYGWSEIYKQLKYHHPWAAAKVQPFIQATRRQSLISVFQDDLDAPPLYEESSSMHLSVENKEPSPTEAEVTIHGAELTSIIGSPRKIAQELVRPSAPPPEHPPELTTSLQIKPLRESVASRSQRVVSVCV